MACAKLLPHEPLVIWIYAENGKEMRGVLSNQANVWDQVEKKWGDAMCK